MNQKGKLLKEWQRILEVRGNLVTRPCQVPPTLYDLHSTDRSGSSTLWKLGYTTKQVKRFTGKELTSLKKLATLAKRHNVKVFVALRFKGIPFLVLPPSIVMKYRSISRDKPPSRLLALYYCPSCMSRYEFRLQDVAGEKPCCGYCGTPLAEDSLIR
ncbi:hypothetical protein HYR54_06820 [Candidatus Acetothermia bacterium]|nr:hypothetical protein [Candidatus Acetothermia bacterium]